MKLDQSHAAADPLSNDLIWGGQAIGDEIGVNRRKAFYLLENKLIPASKIGGVWVASRRKLRARLEGAA